MVSTENQHSPMGNEDSSIGNTHDLAVQFRKLPRLGDAKSDVARIAPVNTM